MGGALRKTMIYLGLAEDDDRYDGYDAFEEEEPEAGGARWAPSEGPQRGGAAAGHRARPSLRSAGGR